MPIPLPRVVLGREGGVLFLRTPHRSAEQKACLRSPGVPAGAPSLVPGPSGALPLPRSSSGRPAASFRGGGWSFPGTCSPPLWCPSGKHPRSRFRCDVSSAGRGGWLWPFPHRSVLPRGDSADLPPVQPSSVPLLVPSLLPLPPPFSNTRERAAPAPLAWQTEARAPREWFPSLRGSV